MAQRQQTITPFQSGQRSNQHEKGGKVPVKSEMAKTRNIGQPDPLVKSLTSIPSHKPASHSFGKTAVQASGKRHAPPPWGKMSKGGR
jgi:hypothetical protein